MNRIILVGNGFDLAHGMKTSYYHFMESFIVTSFARANQDGVFENHFFKVMKNYTGFLHDLPDTLPLCQEYKLVLRNFKYGTAHEQDAAGRGKHFTFIVKDYLMERLLGECDLGWVDVERIYYDILLEIVKPDPHQSAIATDVAALNDSWKILLEHLRAYLDSLELPRKIPGLAGLIYAPINAQDFAGQHISTDKTPETVLFLNFNYTDTVDDYVLKGVTQAPFASMIHIHGALHFRRNHLVFGFGDEKDEHYSLLESQRKKGFLTYIKSFWYFKSSAYREMLRVINADDFQVFIMGHSCGLSDRTMLNMIFEHPFCKSIKIFYHNGLEGYTELTESISRHFTNKQVMREKIVDITRCVPFPQITDFIDD